jgi:Zn-dependent protease
LAFSPQFAQIVNLFLALILSLSLHEAAHALAAKLQGDRTAERLGRLTLNPVPHIDMLGTIILPLIMLFAGGGFFGWAKPVPVDERNLRNRQFGTAIVASAGPISNLLMCALALLVLQVARTSGADLSTGSLAYPFIELLRAMVWVNAILAFFNLVPLPPLDGGAVFSAFLSGRAKQFYEEFLVPYGSWILLALIISGGLRFVGELSESYIGIVNGAIAAVVSR